MESVNKFQILDEVVCISFNVNAHGKGMNQSVLCRLGVIVGGRLGSLVLVRQLVYEKEN